MGFSTPKTPFNLADFLNQKGTPRSSRKPTWKRSGPNAKSPTDDVETTETDTEGLDAQTATRAD